MQIHYGHLARLLHCSIDQALTSAVESMELTAAQGRVVAYVIHAPDPPRPRDIEQAFHLSHPTVSGLLSRLEQKGFLELRTDPNDRRCRRVYILPKGIETFDRMHQAIGAIEERIVQDFAPEERKQFVRLMRRAIYNMGGNPCLSKEEEPKT